MKSNLTRLALALGLSLSTQVRAEFESRVEIHRAVEVEFETETHHTYQLQSSTNLTDWHNEGEVEYGSGRRSSHLSSTQHAGETGHYYRLVPVTVTSTDALAPWSFAGLAIQLLDDSQSPERLDFFTETTGQKTEDTEVDPFTYLLTKTGDNEARTEIFFNNGKSNIVTFSFSSTNTGSFANERFDRGRLRSRKVGTFRLLDGGVSAPGNPPPAESPAPPAALTGLAFNFHSGESPDRIEFLTATTGSVAEDNPRPGEDHPGDTFNYTYTVTGADTASLVITFMQKRGGNDREEYDLTFTSGASGRFVRREFRGMMLRDTDRGAFTPAQPPAPGNPPPDLTGVPPASLLGEVYTFSTGGMPRMLAFATDTTGNQTDDSGPNPFTYTYAISGPAKAALVVTLKSDRWDEYDITFNSQTAGTFTRREFRGGLLNDTDVGTFTRTPGP